MEQGGQRRCRSPVGNSNETWKIRCCVGLEEKHSRWKESVVKRSEVRRNPLPSRERSPGSVRLRTLDGSGKSWYSTGSGQDGACGRSRGPLRAVSTEEMALAKPFRLGARSGSRMLLRLLPEETEAMSGKGAGRERGAGGWGNIAERLLVLLCIPISENVQKTTYMPKDTTFWWFYIIRYTLAQSFSEWSQIPT